MLKLVICCAGGMSSSILCRRVDEEIVRNELQDKVSITYSPFSYIKKEWQKYDIALLCPHQLHSAKRLCEKEEIGIPLYIIPSQIYGTMNLRDLLEDAIDIMQIFKENKENPSHFPDENCIELKRNISHKRWLVLQAKLAKKKAEEV